MKRIIVFFSSYMLDTAVDVFHRCSLLVCLLIFLMLLPLSIQAQDWHLLDSYMTETWYEQVFDEADEPIIYTACGKPADDFAFYQMPDSSKLFLEFHEEHYELLWVDQGENEREFRINYRNEQGGVSVAVLFFDTLMNYLLFNFQGVEYAFVKEKDLEDFRTLDYCPE